MIESAIINRLKSDTTLTGLVTVFNASAAIFANLAPETAVLPYVVIRCDRSNTEGHVIHDFNLFVDYYDYNKSWANCNRAAERIEYALDQQVLTHARYNEIRVNFFAGSAVPSEDSRDVHYNLQFQARATRSKWLIQT